MDYPLIWSGLIAVAVMLYVILDGFDLGVGMLTVFARDEGEGNLMTATIEPVWDGNETWLILGGGGLFAAFPLAYAVLMPAFYLPVLIMLAALIFRGVAFEFRHKAVHPHTRKFWNAAFAYGSLAAAFSQGIILGAFIQGVEVTGRTFSGSGFDCITPFSLLVAFATTIGYVLLGATWLYLKTEGQMQEDARKWVRRCIVGVASGMSCVSLATLSIDPRVTQRWGVTMAEVDLSKFAPLAPIPIIATFLLYRLWRDMRQGNSIPEWWPYVLTVGIFLTGYLGLAISLFPYLVPFEITLWDAAAKDNALAFMLVGAVIMLPIILIYTAFVYKLFWGKVKAGEGYHD